MHYSDASWPYDVLLNSVYNRVELETEDRDDRTGTGTLCNFGNNVMSFYEIWDSFPALTAKKIPMKTTFEELNWFLRGETRISELYKGARPWWIDFTKTTDPEERDYLGPIYGKQWRKWERADGKTVDQIANVIHSIKTNPYSRRHIVSAWNAGEIDEMGLPPCHTMFQFYVSNDGHLDCQLFQRSGDMFLGVPVNIVSYSMLMHLVAAATDLKPRNFYHLISDAHIYKDHFEQVAEYLRRVKAREHASDKKCTMRLTEDGVKAAKEDLSLVKWEHIVIQDYEPMEAIKGRMSV